MTSLFPPVSVSHGHYWLCHARLPLACIDDSVPRFGSTGGRSPWYPQDESVEVHLEIQDGQIQSIRPAHQPADREVPQWNLQQRLVWPCFVDCHTHLDKAHLWPRCENPDGTFGSAITAVQTDYDHWNAADLRARMEFALRCSYAHGTQALRTHLDGVGAQAQLSFEVFDQLRTAWRDRILLQAVSLVSMEVYATPEAEALADLVADYGGILGGVIYPQEGIAERIDRAFALAQARGLALDFHVDESLYPEAQGLRLVAETKLRRNFSHPVTCGHCCSLSVQTDAVVSDTLALVQAAEISIVSLPLCNLYLQDRHPGRMPRYRGVTLLPELRHAGIPVALASDNCRDPFFAYGDHDMLEVFTQGVRIGHLDRPFGPWPQAVTQTAAHIMELPHLGQIGLGRPADFVIFKARSFNELLSRPQSDRIVLRKGVAIDSTLPDYAELDELLAVS